MLTSTASSSADEVAWGYCFKTGVGEKQFNCFDLMKQFTSKFCWHVVIISNKYYMWIMGSSFANHTSVDPSVLPTASASTASSFVSWTWTQGILPCPSLPPVSLLDCYLTLPFLPHQELQGTGHFPLAPLDCLWVFQTTLVFGWVFWLVPDISLKTSFLLTNSLGNKVIWASLTGCSTRPSTTQHLLEAWIKDKRRPFLFV